MSILRPLESSGSSSSEGYLTVGRNNRVGTPPAVNPSNVMKLHCRPELSGMTSIPRAQLGPFASEIHAQSLELLSKRSLPEMERQAIIRAVRQRNHNAPILPLSSADSVVLSHSSASFSENASSYPYHRHQLNISPSYSQGSISSPASSLATISDFNVEKFLLPVLQSAAALEKPAPNQNFANNRAFILPKLKSPDSHRMAIDNAKMDEYQEGIRHKLQELERELLSDNDDAFTVSALSPEQSSHLDREWVDTIQNLLSEEAFLHSTISGESQGYHNNNKENPTSQASRSQLEDQKHSFSSQQEPKTSAMQPHIDAASSSRKLLVECATAISEGETDSALAIITKLMQVISVYGDPMQRLTAYMVEGLVARLGPLGQSLYNTLKWKETPTRDILSASRLLLYDVCPYIKFGYMAANSTILEALKEEEKVHIIDFEIGQGSEYFTLISNLGKKVGGPPKLRITAVIDPDPESILRSVGDFNMVKERHEKLAVAEGVHLKFQIIHQKAADLQPYMLDCRPGEALAVNFAFQLHHMPDESVSTRNPRDQLLRMVKGLNPKVVTVVEKEMNTNTAPFLPRFMEALNYYSAVFESLDISLQRESRERINIEKQCLARDIVNIVACEGAERIERYEVAGKWRARMTMAGFVMYPINTSVDNSVRSLFESCGNNYRLKEEKGALHFGWLDKVLVVVSAWHLESHSMIK